MTPDIWKQIVFENRHTTKLAMEFFLNAIETSYLGYREVDQENLLNALQTAHENKQSLIVSSNHCSHADLPTIRKAFYEMSAGYLYPFQKEICITNRRTDPDFYDGFLEEHNESKWDPVLKFSQEHKKDTGLVEAKMMRLYTQTSGVKIIPVAQASDFNSNINSYVVKANAKITKENLDEATKMLSSGDVVMGIFPEGTRSETGNISKVPSGIRRLIANEALYGKVLVLPIAVHGTDKFLPKGSSFPNIFATTSVSVGEAVPIEDLGRFEGVSPEDYLMALTAKQLPKDKQGDYQDLVKVIFQDA